MSTKALRRRDDGFVISFSEYLAAHPDFEVIEVEDGANPQPDSFLAEHERPAAIAAAADDAVVAEQAAKELRAAEEAAAAEELRAAVDKAAAKAAGKAGK